LIISRLLKSISQVNVSHDPISSDNAISRKSTKKRSMVLESCFSKKEKDEVKKAEEYRDRESQRILSQG
jgi:hypothetical protein